MKPPPCLALLALLPLGCGGAAPTPADPSAVATAQRPAEITVLDLSPPPAAKAPSTSKSP